MYALNDMNFRSDIGLFRVLVIFLLLVFHSFCPYGNYWRDIGLDVPLYYWLDNWSYSFFLQGFIFISGYLYGIQLPKKKAKGLYNIKEELKKKFHRLMIPSLLFTSLYIVLFREGEGWRTPYKIINGVGHLWFLPTLFGCFVCLLLIDRWGIKPKIVILFSLLFSLIPLQGLPIRFDMVCKYFYFLLYSLSGEWSKSSRQNTKMDFIWVGFVPNTIVCRSIWSRKERNWINGESLYPSSSIWNSVFVYRCNCTYLSCKENIS